MEVHFLKTTMYLSLKAKTIRLLSWFPIWEMANLKRRGSFCPGINKSHLSLTFVIAVADIISWRDCWQIDPIIKFKSATQISPFQASCDRNLTALRDDLATDLFELEEEYYSSSYKWLRREILRVFLQMIAFHSWKKNDWIQIEKWEKYQSIAKNH